MIDPVTLNLTGAGLLGLATLGFLWYAQRHSPTGRRYGYAAVVASGAMALSYLGMGIAHGAGFETDAIRFVGYTGLWTAICLVVTGVAGAGRYLTSALLAIVLTRLWVTYASWQLEGTIGTVLTLVPFVLLAAGIYLLFGPFMRAASRVSGERRLLYTKLRNLIVLGWIALVVTGMLGEAAALTDDFISQLVAAYVEVIIVVGFGGIVLRSADALTETAASRPLLSLGSGSDADTLEADTETQAESI
ncbi:bacteriorhodopsin [Natronolimnobius sp. AArcel1]|uniref:bacteriorhodopsin n=1 Tax=Natronolimnobius sp. AArcel1 TaxID=1679093 RepID=UPI0013E9E9D9|nr:bacteriorhodopsin [Natronolimnobius sp. AArcel1]NGM67974.1 bacteriorhodopsin [Natronolimnobius sp. AArcel1]